MQYDIIGNNLILLPLSGSTTETTPAVVTLADRCLENETFVYLSVDTKIMQITLKQDPSNTDIQNAVFDSGAFYELDTQISGNNIIIQMSDSQPFRMYEFCITIKNATSGNLVLDLGTNQKNIKETKVSNTTYHYLSYLHIINVFYCNTVHIFLVCQIFHIFARVCCILFFQQSL